MRTRGTRWLPGLVVLAAVSGYGCKQIIGWEEATLWEPDAGAGGGEGGLGGGGSGGEGGSGGVGGVGGAGGAGGVGGTGGAMPECTSAGDCQGQTNQVATCEMGTCVYTCKAGWGDCTAAPGCETDLNTKAHCGACKKGCGVSCKAGACNDPVSVAGGWYHHCAVLKDGEVYCWGRNEKSEVGPDAPVLSKSPVKVLLPAPGTAKQVAIGSYSGSYRSRTCAVLTDGKVACWGDEITTPTLVAGLSNVAQIAMGDGHACAVDIVGALRCWGFNLYGQVGNGSDTYQFSPVLVGIGYAQVCAGANHSCAVKKDGSVQCWGDNFSGQLGNGLMASSSTPVNVSNLAEVWEVQCGGDFTCARNPIGLYCWGSNSFGQLGKGSVGKENTPLLVDVAGADSVALSHNFAGATAAGTTYMWGSNGNGELGDGTKTLAWKPVAIGLSGATMLGLGIASSCALLSGGRVRCWGDNTYGQIGDGTTASKLTPTLVVWPWP